MTTNKMSLCKELEEIQLATDILPDGLVARNLVKVKAFP